MKWHDLKTWPEFFIPLVEGEKTFEVRRNDRNYEVGDRLCLREYLTSENRYTGREVIREVTYIAELGAIDGNLDGIVAMSVKPVEET